MCTKVLHQIRTSCLEKQRSKTLVLRYYHLNFSISDFNYILQAQMAAAEKFKQQSEPVAQKPAVTKIEEEEEEEGEVYIDSSRSSNEILKFESIGG